MVTGYFGEMSAHGNARRCRLAVRCLVGRAGIFRPARAFGLKIFGLIVNFAEPGGSDRRTWSALEAETGLPILGVVPHRPKPAAFDAVAKALLRLGF